MSRGLVPHRQQGHQRRSGSGVGVLHLLATGLIGEEAHTKTVLEGEMMGEGDGWLNVVLSYSEESN
ncbi:hypothetical protein AMTR_s00054p00189270 [Amborella trichopoda]|uniref:Uncharacterized protein n=1 Tax=Amborella trichopoda TaxID=13333 RepID=U5DCQ4_AMBTC|nr:hypothetical protein AMTR_s00054p00189270 [Amborella trichopoda]